MGLSKEVSKLIALQYASKRYGMRMKLILYGQSNAIQKFAFDFLEAYSQCRKLPIQGSPDPYWQELADNPDNRD